MMRKIALAALSVLLMGLTAAAQNNNSGRYEADSLVFIPAATLDSSLVGRRVMDVIGAEVSQSDQILSGLDSRIEKNAARKISGYRVRIFFDNRQNARQESEAAMKAFLASFPGYAAYRSFANPFFKVTVGDFRTRSEATRLLQRVKGMYPSAILIKETINYPVVNTHESDEQAGS